MGELVQIVLPKLLVSHFGEQTLQLIVMNLKELCYWLFVVVIKGRIGSDSPSQAFSVTFWWTGPLINGYEFKWAVLLIICCSD